MKTDIVFIIKNYISSILKLNNNKANKAGLIDLYKEQIYFEPTAKTLGSNYSSVTDGGASLCGNVLRIFFEATRKSNTGTGDVSNETIVTFKYNNPGGRIGGYLANSGVSSGTGPLTAYYGYLENITATSFDVKILLTGIHSAATSLSGYILIPIRLNIPS